MKFQAFPESIPGARSAALNDHLGGRVRGILLVRMAEIRLRFRV